MSSTMVLAVTDSPLEHSLRMSTVEDRYTEDIIYTDCSTGLGIKIIGGCSEDGLRNYGIFVKKVLPGGLAADDGRLHEMDQIMEVNGECALHVTNERAVSLLRAASASDYVHLKICRDHYSREEYKQLTENHNPSSSSECNSIASRTNTPSFYDKQIWSQDERLSEPLENPVLIKKTTSPTYAPTNVHTAALEGRMENDNDVRGPLISKMGHQEEMLAPAELLITQKRLHLQPAMSSTPQYNAENPPRGSINPPVTSVSPPPSMSPRGMEDPSPVLPSGSLHRTVPSNISSELGLTGQSEYEKYPSASYDQDDRTLSSRQVYNESTRTSDKRNTLQSSSMSIDPQSRIKVDKLQTALRYLGCEPTQEQNLELRKILDIDDRGTVSYGDFVQAARKILQFQIKEKNFSPGATFVSCDHGDTNMTSFTQPQQSYNIQDVPNHAITTPQDVLGQVSEERDSLRREIERLNSLLKEKEGACTLAEEELLRVRREAQGAIHENRSLRSKIHLAEQAQHAARSMEQDYEEVVRLLENEIAQLRASANKQMKPASEHKTDTIDSMKDSPAVQKRLAVLGAQLRKSEISKKTYEVATEKLLHFAETVHSTLTTQGDGGTLSRIENNRGESSKGSQPPSYLGKHKRHTANTLAAEAKEVVRAVKSLIDVDPLPFGWDEAYTADGVKYYINHVTQTTSWTHPVSNVEHLSAPANHDTDHSPETRM